MVKIDYESFKGKKYRYLTFIEALPSINKRRRPIRVICECGKEKIVDWDNLKSGKTKSCGCKQHKERWDGTEHPLRKIWTAIKQRCNNPNSSSYKYYGAKGVSICEEWANSYPNFYKWCMDNGWGKGLDIDKDIKGNGMLYSPETCIFVTHKENMGEIDQRIVSREMATSILESKESGRSLAKKMKLTRDIIYKIRNNTYWKQ